MSSSIFLDSIFSNDEIQELLHNEEVLRNREHLTNHEKVRFSVELSKTMREKLITSLQLSVDLPIKIPMSWISNDSLPHIDSGEADFQNTIIVYLSNSSGSLIIDDQSYDIQQNRAFTFPRGSNHYTQNTSAEDGQPRLMIGPMSETGFPVGVGVLYFPTSADVFPDPNFSNLVYSSGDSTISATTTFPDSSSISPPSPGLTLLYWAGQEGYTGNYTDVSYNPGDTWPGIANTFLYPVWSTPIEPPLPITLYYYYPSDASGPNTFIVPPDPSNALYSEIKDPSDNPQYIASTNTLPGDIVIDPPTPGLTLLGWQGVQYEVIDNAVVYTDVSYNLGDLWPTTYNTYLYPVWSTPIEPPLPITLYYYYPSDASGPNTFIVPPDPSNALYSEIKDPSDNPQYIASTNTLPGDIVIDPPTPGLTLLGWQGVQYEVIDNAVVYTDVSYNLGDLWPTTYNTYLYPVWSTPIEPPMPITLYYFVDQATMSNPPNTGSALYYEIKDPSENPQYIASTNVLPGDIVIAPPSPGLIIIGWQGLQYEVIDNVVVYADVSYNLGDLWPTTYNTYLYPVWSTPIEPPLPITLYYFVDEATMSNPPNTIVAVYSEIKDPSDNPQYIANSSVLPTYTINPPSHGYILSGWRGLQFEVINNVIVYTPISYSLGDLWPAVYNTYIYPVWERIMCFKENTKILCLNPMDGKTDIYVPIQQLRAGHLVKTLSSGYQPIYMIGKSKIYNPANSLRYKNRLFKCSKENYPEIIEDLYITGCHSILVDKLSDKEREDCIDIMGKVYVTENRYRMMACIDERAKPYEEEGLYTIWHFALENADIRMNYGIFANGLLVETSSKRMMSQYSGMELL